MSFANKDAHRPRIPQKGYPGPSDSPRGGVLFLVSEVPLYQVAPGAEDLAVDGACPCSPVTPVQGYLANKKTLTPLGPP